MSFSQGLTSANLAAVVGGGGSEPKCFLYLFSDLTGKVGSRTELLGPGRIIYNSQQAGQGHRFSTPSPALLLACITGPTSVDQDFCLHFCGVFVPYPKYGIAC